LILKIKKTKTKYLVKSNHSPKSMCRLKHRDSPLRNLPEYCTICWDTHLCKAANLPFAKASEMNIDKKGAMKGARAAIN